MSQFWEELLGYFDSGGIVMPPLAISTIILWYALGYRYMVLQRGNRRSPRILVKRYIQGYNREPSGIVDTAITMGITILCDNPKHRKDLRHLLDDSFSPIELSLYRGKALIKSIVSVAPLAGLLGTVIGMIETFDSLGDGALYSQSGGIAGGISQALFTTQMGLAVAVPGIVVGRILDRKQQRLQHELVQIKDLLCAEAEAVGASRLPQPEPKQ
ncbi:MAG: MotA/TolQ/ExbB proton channel family protein [Polyangiaceae bacterium]|nr:MotA/TolQ/ExbB proton channel family protein [Polyangiaceae bacterium]